MPMPWRLRWPQRFLAATSTKVAVYLLIRYIFSIYGIEFVAMSLPLDDIFLIFGLVGIFAASITAIYQLNIKRVFAYSSVAQIGYMILGLAIGTKMGTDRDPFASFQSCPDESGAFSCNRGDRLQDRKLSAQSSCRIGAQDAVDHGGDRGRGSESCRGAAHRRFL